MLGRLLITVSFAALLSAAPAVAQEVQDQGMTNQDGQSGQILKKKKLIQPEGQATGKATGNQQPAQDQATGQPDQSTNKKLKKSQEVTSDQQSGQKKKAQQNTQTEQMTGEKAIGTEGQTTKKKKVQQTEQNQSSDQMTTGATGKVETELAPEKKTIIRERIVTKNVTRIERDKVDFDISVGIVVPTTTIHLQPLPPDIVEVVPEYSGYLFFVLADGTIVIVEPNSYKIVFIVTA